MAEVAAAASVLGIASFAIEVSKGLLAAGKVLVQARGQIARLTKHVSQFGAVIRQVGLVLKRDGPGLCSSELLREIRRIVRSCHATLREIHYAATSSLEKPLAAVRWLFVKGKAKELEAQLESQKVMLQIMMHTVTVSRLGQLRNSSVEDAEQAARAQAESAEQTSRIQAENAEQNAHLRAEIELLKTLIVNGRHEIGRLRRMETADQQQSPDSQGKKSSSGSSDESSESSDETTNTSSSSNEISSEDDADKNSQSKALALRHRSGTHSNGLSTMLTRMIPLGTAGEQDSEQKRDRGLLTASAHDDKPTNEGGADHLDEALRSTRLLLDKWTIPGSESAMTALGEESAIVSSKQSPLEDSARSNPHQVLSDEHPTNDTFDSYQDFLFERVSQFYINEVSTEENTCKYLKVTPEKLHTSLQTMPTTRVPKIWIDTESLVKHGFTSFTEGQLTWILDGDIDFELITSCIHDTYERYLEPEQAEACHNGSHDHKGGPWTDQLRSLPHARYMLFVESIKKDILETEERVRYYCTIPSATSEQDGSDKHPTNRRKQKVDEYCYTRKASGGNNDSEHLRSPHPYYSKAVKLQPFAKDTNEGHSPAPRAMRTREELKSSKPGTTNPGKQPNISPSSHKRTGRGNASGGVGDPGVESSTRRRPYNRPKVYSDPGSDDSEVERFMSAPTLRRAATMPHKDRTERENTPTRWQGAGGSPNGREVRADLASARDFWHGLLPDESSRRIERKREELEGKYKDKQREKTAETKAQTKERAKDARRRNETKRTAYVESESDNSEIERFMGGPKHRPDSIY